MLIEALDVAAVTFSFVSFVVYHLHLYLSVFLYQNSKAHLSKVIESSYFWIKKHQDKDDAPHITLAIQTFRNTIIVAIFVGGAAFTLGLSYSDAYLSDIDVTTQIRSVVLSILCICSFLCFALVIRLSSQLGYLVGTLNIAYAHKVYDQPNDPRSETAVSIVPETTDPNAPTAQPANLVSAVESANKEELIRTTKNRQLKRCTNIMIMNLLMFSLGFRFLFVALPFAFYSMGPIGLIIATFLMLSFLMIYDYGVTAFANSQHFEYDHKYD